MTGFFLGIVVGIAVTIAFNIFRAKITDKVGKL
jgi:hypothetical protein